MVRVAQALALVALSAACSTLIDEHGLSLECRGEVCPPIEHVGAVIVAFGDRVPGYDIDRRLHVVWRDDSEIDAATGYMGFAYPWYDEVHVSSSCVLAHEQMHVFLWDATGDAGADHLGDSPDPWPWTMAAELAVGDVCAHFRGEGAF